MFDFSDQIKNVSASQQTGFDTVVKGKKSVERGVQLSISAQITNMQSTVNRPQVEAHCGKEEVRNLL